MTNAEMWNYGVVGGMLLLYLLIALFARSGSTRDFFIAGGRVGTLANGMATAANAMTGLTFAALVGLVAAEGYGSSSVILGVTGGYALIALLFAPYVRKAGSFTVPEFLGDRFGCGLVRLITLLCVLVISLALLVGQIGSLGVAFSRFLDLPSDQGLYLGLGILTLFVLIGGMRGITYSQVLQYMVLVFAVCVPAVFVSLALTGNPAPQAGLTLPLLGDGTSQALLTKVNQAVTDLGFAQFTTATASDQINFVALTLTLMLGTAALPHVLTRFMTVRRVRTARYSAAWALAFIAIIFTTASSLGAMTRLQFVGAVQTGPVGSSEANMAYDSRPDWFKRAEEQGQLSFDDKNGDGLVEMYDDANADFAAGVADQGWKGNELSVLDKSMLLSTNPQLASVPPWAIALMIAGAMAALLASAAGLLLAVGAALSHDLIKGILVRRLPEKAELWLARIAVLGASAGAGFIALNPPQMPAEVLFLALGLAAASIFPTLLLSVFSLRVNRFGAALGMLAGLAATLAYLFQHEGILFMPETAFLMPERGLGPNWFLGIQPVGFGVVGALVNLVVALLISKITWKPSAAAVAFAEDIRVPARTEPAAST